MARDDAERREPVAHDLRAVGGADAEIEVVPYDPGCPHGLRSIRSSTRPTSTPRPQRGAGSTPLVLPAIRPITFARLRAKSALVDPRCLAVELIVWLQMLAFIDHPARCWEP